MSDEDADNPCLDPCYDPELTGDGTWDGEAIRCVAGTGHCVCRGERRCSESGYCTGDAGRCGARFVARPGRESSTTSTTLAPTTSQRRFFLARTTPDPLASNESLNASSASSTTTPLPDLYAGGDQLVARQAAGSFVDFDPLKLFLVLFFVVGLASVIVCACFTVQWHLETTRQREKKLAKQRKADLATSTETKEATARNEAQSQANFLAIANAPTASTKLTPVGQPALQHGEVSGMTMSTEVEGTLDLNESGPRKAAWSSGTRLNPNGSKSKLHNAPSSSPSMAAANLSHLRLPKPNPKVVPNPQT